MDYYLATEEIFLCFFDQLNDAFVFAWIILFLQLTD